MTLSGAGLHLDLCGLYSRLQNLKEKSEGISVVAKKMTRECPTNYLRSSQRKVQFKERGKVGGTHIYFGEVNRVRAHPLLRCSYLECLA